MDNSPHTSRASLTLTDELCHSLLDAFPASAYEHTYHEYSGGRSRARVLAVRFRAVSAGGLSGPFVVKLGSDRWADEEDAFYADPSAAALAPLLAAKRYRSASVSGFSAIAYDMAFDSVFAQSLYDLLDDRSVDQSHIQEQVARVAHSLATWYLEQPSRHWRLQDPKAKADCTAVLQHMLTERRVADMRELLRPWFTAGDIDADWLVLDSGTRRLPNPIAYLYRHELWPATYRPFLRCSRIHGDLHVGNILCDGRAEKLPTLIDFGQSTPDGIPFFDLAYLEFDLLQHALPVSEPTHRRDWLQLLQIIMSDVLPNQLPSGHSRVAWELIQPLREEARRLIDAHLDEKEDAKLAWWLSTVAAGLNWARKGGSEPRIEERYAGVLYAAFGLERVLAERFPPHHAESASTVFMPWIGVATPSTEARHDFFDLRAPRLDEYLVERTRETFRARDIVLQSAAGSSVAITSARKARATALHGIGGIGKSVLARMLCEDPLIRQAFPNGVLWATIGESPKESELADRLRDWITALGGAIPGSAPSLDLLHQLLEERLRDRAYLLVVDDVWQFDHLALFRAGGQHCRLVFTTRIEAIATKVGARVVIVPVMEEPEAISLLESWAEGALDRQSIGVKRKLVNRLGRLPLALRLAGPQLRDGNPADWIKTFDITKARLPESDQSDDVHDSLVATFELSLQRLHVDVRPLLFALSIFKEDEPIPASAIFHLWHGLADLDQGAVSALLEKLRSNALVEVTGDPRRRLASLHDLMRELLARRLGDNNHRAHQAMLSSYRSTSSVEGWHNAEDDGYLYDHLAYHLSAVGAYDELMGLFRDDRWLESRVRGRGYTYDGYLADLAYAEDICEAVVRHAIDARQELTTLPDSLQCKLIRASINSISENYLPEHVASAVEAELWSADRAISVALRIPDARKRFKMSLALLTTTKLLSDQRSRIEAVIVEASNLAGDSVWMMAEVAPQYIVELDRHLVYTSLESLYEDARVTQVDIQSRYLTSEGAVSALDAVMEIGNNYSRAQALVALIPQLGAEQARQAREAALSAALAIQDEYYRAQALVALIPQLGAEQARQAQEAALSAALAIPNEYYRVQALVALAAQLRPEQAEQVLEAALITQDESERVRVLVALAPQLGPEQARQAREAALSTALAILDGYSRVQALVALVPQLGPGQALEAALAIPNDTLRAQALVDLVAQLGPEQAERALGVALAIPIEVYRAQALVALIPQLGPEQAERALEAALITRNESERVRVLVALAPQLGPEQAERALEAALITQGESERVRVLVALAPQLGPEQAERALEASMAIPTPYYQAQVLQMLVPYLSSIQTGQVLERARITHSLGTQSLLLSALRHHFSDAELSLSLRQTRSKIDTLTVKHGDLEVVLAAARAIHDEDAEARPVAAAANRLPKAEYVRAVARAQLSGAKMWLSDATSGEVSSARFAQTLDAALAVGSHDLIATIEVLAERLSTAITEQTLRAILALPDEIAKAWLLGLLAPDLSEDEVTLALDAALSMLDRTSQALALSALAPRLDIWECTRAIAAATSTERLQAMIIAALADAKLSKEQIKIVVASAITLVDEASRARALAALAPYPTGWERTTMLDAVDVITDDEHRAWVMIALVLAEEGPTCSRMSDLAEQLAELVRTGLTPLPVLELATALEWLTFLNRLVPIATAQPALLTYIRSRVVDVVSSLGEWSRRDVLTLLGIDHVLTPPVVSADWDFHLLSSILSVCHTWNWL